LCRTAFPDRKYTERQKQIISTSLLLHPSNSVDIHPSLAMFTMESDESSQQLESQLTQQPATQQLQQVPENTKNPSKKTKRKKTIGHHPSKKVSKLNKSLAASDVIVPPVPNLVPLGAVHPLQDVPQVFPLNLVPPVVLEQPLNPPHTSSNRTSSRGWCY
jgi:hypothetical protein